MNRSASLLADVRAMRPMLTARGAEFEAARRIPLDLVDAMKTMGVFRLFVPHSYSGLELDLPIILDVLRELSAGDASVGWTAMIGSGSALFASMLPSAAYERIYRGGPDTILAGSTQLLGVAEPTDGGWRVTGRWPFASGCLHADWMLGFCRLQSGEPATPPRVRVVVLPASEWRIEDTWHVPGLKGTGSHHIALDRVVVSESDLFDVSHGWPWLEGPLYAGVQQIIALLHGAVSLGIAEGALEDLVALAGTKRRQQNAAAPMRETEAFQFELGRIQAEVRAARAFLAAQAESHWHAALAGTIASNAMLIEGSQTAIWVVGTSLRAVDACFSLAGSDALYETSPLQRRMRDIHVAAQHNLMQPRHYRKSGALLAGAAV
jgi:alkylation response protein AidB-like acyl-CoA dehydrogenase